jgi:hypothetical protein
VRAANSVEGILVFGQMVEVRWIDGAQFGKRSLLADEDSKPGRYRGDEQSIAQYLFARELPK